MFSDHTLKMYMQNLSLCPALIPFCWLCDTQMVQNDLYTLKAFVDFLHDKMSLDQTESELKVLWFHL